MIRKNLYIWEDQDKALEDLEIREGVQKSLYIRLAIDDFLKRKGIDLSKYRDGNTDTGGVKKEKKQPNP